MGPLTHGVLFDLIWLPFDDVGGWLEDMCVEWADWWVDDDDVLKIPFPRGLEDSPWREEGAAERRIL